ncbi:metalloproteinase inhibitor 2 [Austrofundulus limnaeus]|uniref:Metalloproteinase inhibitor 2 n=1 Tax=Austrofundulus limnaeus TaxID=52670 RepID=A0A2I4CGV3_AUSLI|nr:PREDICTED: metalloproteinase inhibitor 2-like [Austrofundulus limnaeus]
MTWVMKSCFITLVLVFLWRVEKGVESCKCMIIDPQKALCDSDVVFRVNVTGRQEIENFGNSYTIKYDLDIIEIFKGPEGTGGVYSSPPCRADLQTDGKEYLITAPVGFFQPSASTVLTLVLIFGFLSLLSPWNGTSLYLTSWISTHACLTEPRILTVQLLLDFCV